jgi:hypothetical protein
MPAPLASLSQIIKEFYDSHERILGLTFFAAGVIWDALTLRTIDNLVDNLILLGYLAGLTTVITLDVRAHSGHLTISRIEDPRAWLRAALQFLLGALLSAFVIFYARSITWSSHLAFWLVLVVGAIMNEFLTRKLSSFPAQLALLFLCSSTMLAWLLPVMTGEMSLRMFRVSLLASLALTALVFWYGKHVGRVKGSRLGPVEVWIIPVLFALLEVGYRQNWIPPVPLSVQQGGIYNDVARDGDDFALTWDTRQRGLFAPDYARTVYWKPGEQVYCFTAVFAPTKLFKQVVHEWQRLDSATEEWITTDRIEYRMNGGREGGYRGTTFKRNMSEGQWRVLVKTEEGKMLTRIPFHVVEGAPGGVFWSRTVTR